MSELLPPEIRSEPLNYKEIMAANEQAQQHAPLFSKFGLTIYRKDVEDALSGALAHPWAAVVLAAIAMSIALLVLVTAGGIKPNLLVYIILGVPVAGIAIVVLVLVMEMKVKTLIPILCVLVAILILVDGGSGLSHYWTLVAQKHLSQSEEQQFHSALPPQESPNVHNEYETIAQSACTSMAVKEGHAGWTFAVQRQCDSSTKPCEAICATQALHTQDKQSSLKQWSCLGALHVYRERPVSQPSTTSKPSMGFKVYWSPGYHTGQNCGPNYCCCFAAS